MTMNEARQTLNTAARKHTCVVYFTKKDGTPHRMVCRYYGAASRKASQLVVWDLEKGDERTINLDTVTMIRVLTGRTDRKPVKRDRTFAELKALTDSLF